MPTTSPLMGLTVPQLKDKTPSYVTALAASLGLLDSHNHAAGNGTPVPTAGLGIDSDLTFNGYSATTLRSVQMYAQPAPLDATQDNNSLFVFGGNLFFLNGSNQLVQISSGGYLYGAPLGGGFNGDYGTYSASATYTHATKQYTFLDEAAALATINIGGANLSGMLSVANLAATAETGSGNGRIYYDTTNNRLRAYVNGAWKTITVA